MSPRPIYAVSAGICFIILILLVFYPSARIIRGNFGDVIVITFLFLLIKTIRDVPRFPLACAVFLFGCAVEFLQYLGLASQLGIKKHTVLYVILGATYDPLDIVAYAIGAILAILLDVTIFSWLRARTNPGN